MELLEGEAMNDGNLMIGIRNAILFAIPFWLGVYWYAC